MTASRARGRFRWPVCTVPMRRVLRYVRSTASISRTSEGVVLHSKDICASAAAIASYACPFGAPAISANPRQISAAAARWINAPSAPVARKMTILLARVPEIRPQSTLPKASCRYVRGNVLHQGIAGGRWRRAVEHLPQAVINRGASAFDWGVNFNSSKIQG